MSWIYSFYYRKSQLYPSESSAMNPHVPGAQPQLPTHASLRCALHLTLWIILKHEMPSCLGDHPNLVTQRFL